MSAFVRKQNLIFLVRSARFSLPQDLQVEEEKKVFPALKTPPVTSSERKR